MRIAPAFMRDPIAPPVKVLTAADVVAIESVDWQDRVAGHTPFTAILSQAQRQATAPAIIDLIEEDGELHAQTISYAELGDSLVRTANLFASLAHGKPPVVAIVAPSRPDALSCLWAASSTGCAAPINPFLKFEHIRGILNAIEADVVVISGRHLAVDTYDALLALGEASGGPVVLCLDQPEESSSFSQLIAAQSPELISAQLAGSGEVTALFHTGGTTASPKLVKHTGGQQLLNAWCADALYTDGPAPVIAHGMPNFHVGGAIVSALRALMFGYKLLNLTPSGFRSPIVVGRFWSLAEEFGITSMLATPTTYGVLLGTASSQVGTNVDMVAGGSGLPLALGRLFRSQLGLSIRQLWGMTEGHGVLAFQRPGTLVEGSVGPPIPYHAVKLDENGVVLVGGPCVTTGYLGDESEGLLLHDKAGTWLVTGDTGRISDDGELFIVGRAKDIIIRGGHNLDPAVIEDAAAQHEAVLYAAAVGKPDAQKGELPVLFAQLKPGHDIEPSQLCEFCADRVTERAAAPVEVRLIREMPVTAVGKIFRPALREQLITETIASELARHLPDVNYKLSMTERGVAVIRLADASQRISEVGRRIEALLQQFTFPFEIS